jgi:ankyrin repeat protein
MFSSASSELLLNAAMQGDLQQVQSLILEARANPNYRNSVGETTMHAAAHRGLVSMIELLVALGADPNVAQHSRYGGRTPLHVAVRGNHIKAVETLLERNADANIPDAVGKTPLHDACITRNATMVRLLLRSGAAPECPDKLARLPIDYARDRNDIAIVAILTPRVEDGEAPPPRQTFADMHPVKWGTTGE